MATPGTPPASGAPPSGAPAPNPGQGQGGGNNPLQLVAAITKLAQMLAQASPACAPGAEKIMGGAQECAEKIMGASKPQGGGGPGPY